MMCCAELANPPSPPPSLCLDPPVPRYSRSFPVATCRHLGAYSSTRRQQIVRVREAAVECSDANSRHSPNHRLPLAPKGPDGCASATRRVSCPLHPALYSFVARGRRTLLQSSPSYCQLRPRPDTHSVDHCPRSYRGFDDGGHDAATRLIDCHRAIEFSIN